MQKFILAVSLFLIMTIAACVQVVTPLPASPGNDAVPTIIQFEASPSSVYAGGTSNLSWEITNAASASIDQEVGPVALKGSSSVTPTSTTMYTLTATNKYGTSSLMVQVTVTGPQPAGNPNIYNLPVVTVFTVEPANIASGGKAILRWEVQNSFDVEIAPGLSIISPQGSMEVSPPFQTMYKLTARNAQGSIVATTTLTVSGGPPDEETPVIKYFTATPYVIKQGESATLSWESIQGSSASINNGVGVVDGSGTVQVTPGSTTTYMLTVINPRGAQFQTTTVNVR